VPDPPARAARVLLGISGGIAAYKGAYLVRRLRERGIHVRCAPTLAAESFVSPLSLEVLSGERVYGQSYLSRDGGVDGAELHVEAAHWADLLCVAPATANTLARLSLGLADDFLSTTALMFEGPVVVAPAMHDAMWRKPQVEAQVDALRARGVEMVGPVEGALASGERGLGRMAEPEAIVDAVCRLLALPEGTVASPVGPLAGWRVVVTAGPTYEAIDPVRFLGNRSSGRMGFALARQAALRGADVTLVAGPVNQATPEGVHRIDVVSAFEMQAALEEASPAADLIVMAAAVADYRPRERADQKLKKSGTAGLMLELEQNPDLLAGLAASAPDALRVGFAAETADLEGSARSKLEAKKVHWIVANDVSRSDIGFEAADNEVVVFGRGGNPVRFPKQSKEELAGRLLELFTGDRPLRASAS
jgi:phosphopantothenoylcysteine decarboxylase/phosphopantothenate--cysteine ligase